ncbi:Zinc finger, RING-CH-type domain and Zinc finger, RING/FYVE/PHD-type domain-containing protein [Strongyloides ratti]|uniref:Zinc finger, RING-CH-type domain and Zinc finger, RING/FYVE/PHD-type domain-containing protein n=1 Tax=Strongyloides ratti TaxID=34506 RepID=A0A090LQ91_STRRB|nr:Zinc finger, RING-CH-type domain and Zinc finger, RING/FYVE/PHD-type domain-containing protein [Strongyloides ratti]CEF70344.1 Zinc finger, RING-CH-type domain and Zinc finger, RING/FYVE/PHD-type domain-containing protein [Strongyloides ratti]
MESTKIEYTPFSYSSEKSCLSQNNHKNNIFEKKKLWKGLESTNRSISISDRTIDKRICRICFDGNSPNDMVSPCKCKGSCQYVHNSCLTKWYESSGRGSCEICKFEFLISREGFKLFFEMTTPKPFSDDMEDIVDYYCAFMWFGFILSLIYQSFSIGIKNTFYMVCLFKGHPFGVILTIVGMSINMIYYTEVLIEVFEKWYIENSRFKWANYIPEKKIKV